MAAYPAAIWLDRSLSGRYRLPATGYPLPATRYRPDPINWVRMTDDGRRSDVGRRLDHDARTAGEIVESVFLEETQHLW